MNMNEMIQKAAGIVTNILARIESRQLPLKDVKIRVSEKLEGADDINATVDKAIEWALDNWIVDKVLDYDEDDEEFAGELVWFLRATTEEEAEYLGRLSKAEHALLNILRNAENESRLGVIRANEALQRLRKLGFDLKSAPSIIGKTSSFFRPENGKLIEFKYLLSEEEKSEEYVTALKELDEKERRKQERLDRMNE